MEMFGNPVTGYTTEYYSMLIEQMAEINKKTLSGSLNGHNVICKGNSCYISNNLTYAGDRGSRNSSSQISQEGLEKRAERQEKRAKLLKKIQNFPIKKVLIPKRLYHVEYMNNGKNK